MANIISEFGTLTGTGSGADGANCVITNITPISGGNRVTFQWTDPDGTTRTETMDVMDGTAGKSIQSVQINSQGHLIVYYDDGTSEDAGYVGGGSGVTVDDTMSTTSTNPVQNKVITNAINYLIWSGTQDEWAALPSSEKEKYKYVFFTDDEGGVIPNPTLVGTEDILTGLQIDGTKYKVGIGIKSVNISANNHLIITYDDDTTQDAGEISGGGGSSDPDALPSFYVTEYDDTIQKVQQLAFNSTDSFAFGFTSDLHFCTKDSQFSDRDKDRLRSGITRMMKAFGKFSRQFPLATTIIGGDFAYFYNNSIKQNDVDNIMEIGEWMSKFDGNRIVFRGNHEYKYSGDSGESAGLDIDEFYDICSRKYVSGKIEKISKTVYCQIDDVDGVCFIYINALFAPILDSTLKSELRAVFAKNTNNYPYIISTHYGMENKSGAPAYIVDGTKYVIDFVKTNSGPIIAWIAGHAHADWHGVWNDTLIMTTEAAGYYSTKVSEDGNTYSKTLNTASESAFSIYTVDKAMGKLYCTRFGAGVDRVYHYTDYSGAIGSATDYAYSIIQNLTGVTSDFNKLGTDSDVTIHLTPENVGDTLNVTVLMGSTDVTSTVWDSSTGYVTITGATDDITITATVSAGAIVLLDVENADNVEPYNSIKGTVSTSGNNFTCSITAGGGGIRITNNVKPTWAQFTSGKTATYKCDSYTCDISGSFLPGYVQLHFYANGESLGYQGAFVDTSVSNINEALQVMSTTGLTVQHAGYWDQADRIDLELRTSTNGGVAIDPPFTLNVNNLRLELDET